jgi:hypothetical protein
MYSGKIAVPPGGGGIVKLPQVKICNFNTCFLYRKLCAIIITYIIIQNKLHRGRRWKFKFTLAARPVLIIP